MGRDKARLRPRPAAPTLAERAHDRLREVCTEVLVADGGRGLVPGARSVADAPPAGGPAAGVGLDRRAAGGPAAGLVGAAAVRPGVALLALACDQPRVGERLLALLAERFAASGADLVVAESARGPEPLPAVYGPRALAALAERRRAGRASLSGLLEVPGLSVVRIGVGELAAHGVDPEVFASLNRPADWRAYVEEEEEEERAAAQASQGQSSRRKSNR